MSFDEVLELLASNYLTTGGTVDRVPASYRWSSDLGTVAKVLIGHPQVEMWLDPRALQLAEAMTRRQATGDAWRTFQNERRSWYPGSVGSHTPERIRWRRLQERLQVYEQMASWSAPTTP